MRTYDERTRYVQEKLEKMKLAQKKRRRAVKLGITGAVAAVMALVLFLPYNTAPPDVSRYAGSEYYELICKLNEATFEKPRYKNNFEKLTDGFYKTVTSIGMTGSAMAPENALDGDGAMGNGQNYVEVTDNQVQGVIEDDLFKRSDRYLYYLADPHLLIYEIAGEETRLLSCVSVEDLMYPQRVGSDGYSMYYSAQGIYLSADCTTVTVLMSGADPDIGACSLAVNLDVADPENVTIRNAVYLTGSYSSSRMVGGDLLLMNEFVVRSNCDFSDEASFLPQAGVPGNMVSVAAEDIVAPQELSHTRYSVVCKLDGETLQVLGSAAVLSYSDTVYVSEDTVFATRGYEHRQDHADGSCTFSNKTDISGIYYGGEGLQVLGNITLDGYVKDQYSMDQYEGSLRVFTTAAAPTTYYPSGDASSDMSNGSQNVNLYCVDLSEWAVAASVLAFAPPGEEATSVRFDGPYAYVCTAEIITLSDPVYFFDLSDINNITYTDTGTIDGYSTSLIQLGDGYLLGIGFGDSWQLKVEVYEQSADGVVSVCAYVQEASFPQEYKSYFIDRENDLVGLMLCDYQHNYRYVLLHFNGYELTEAASVDVGEVSDMTRTRAAIIDGYLYVLFLPDAVYLEHTDSCLRVAKLSE